MSLLLVFFWFSLGALVYCYFGYGLLAFAVSGIKKFFVPSKHRVRSAGLMPVSLVVTAYNEEEVLQEKIQNILRLDYPTELLRVYFVIDGSTDRSTDIIASHSFITLINQPQRKGKAAAIKRAMQLVQTPVVIFSDANTLLNEDCIRKIVAHYSDPSVGGVAGEKKVLAGGASAVGWAEGMYWRYESFMKRMDAGLYSVVGAAGELFSIRSELFRDMSEDWILDDFNLSMQVCLQGYKMNYEPGAIATESPSASLADEEKRKIRISAGAYQSISYLKNNLNVFKHPLLAFQFVSRRLFRWVICPPSLFVLLFTNIWLAGISHGAIFFSVLLWAQIIFYGMALLGTLLMRAGQSAGPFTIPSYFLFMNYCLLRGFIRFTQRKQTVLWEKSLRQAIE